MVTTKLDGLGFGDCDWTVAHRNRMVSEACFRRMVETGMVSVSIKYSVLCWVTMPYSYVSARDLSFEAKVRMRVVMPHKIRHVSFKQAIGRVLHKAGPIHPQGGATPMSERLKDVERKFRLVTVGGGVLEAAVADRLMLSSLCAAIFNILEEEGVI